MTSNNAVEFIYITADNNWTNCFQSSHYYINTPTYYFDLLSI